MIRLPFTALAFLLLLASCASDIRKNKDEASASPPRKSFSERINEKNGFKQDSEGNWKIENNQRSPYENQGTTYDAKKSFKKSEYKTGDFAKKSWWGNKDYAHKNYTGNTDGSRFQKGSALQGQKAPETSTLAKIAGPFKTENYATTSARESESKRIKKTSNSIVDSKEKTFQQPEIVDWRAQRSLTLEQSKGILGR